MKLAFLSHSVYGMTDLSYDLLKSIDDDLATAYWTSEVEGSSQSNAPVAKGAPQRSRTGIASGSARKPTPTEYEFGLDEPIFVVDIGANPIDGTPPYSELLKRGDVKLVGFEPEECALMELQSRKGPHEEYLPHAVGDGRAANLYVCRASGMTSTLRPNRSLLDWFQGYPIWGAIERVERITTVRLDDLEAIERIDWLKIDIQGGELAVFRHGANKLRSALVIQTEVNFVPLYENQPLFAEIDQWMRAHGFMLHALIDQRRRLYAPMALNGQIHHGLNQITTADAVYIPDLASIERMGDQALRKLGSILHFAYNSYDLVLKILTILDLRTQGRAAEQYLAYLKALPAP